MKKLFLWGSFIMIPLVLFCWLFLSIQSAPLELPFSFCSSLYPLVKVKIEGEPYLFELALNSKYPASLQASKLEGMQKKLKGNAKWTELDYSVHSAPLYELPCFEIGKIKMKKVDVVAQDTISPDGFGILVWPFKQINLVLDYPHQKVWGIKQEKNLRDLGLDPGKMIQLKIQYGPKNDIVIPVVTSLGELKMGLTTMCNGNLISSDCWKGEEGECLSTSVQVAGQSIGSQDFHPLDVPSELGVDGFLGYSFLSKHIIYIDALNQTLYIGGEKGNTLSNGCLVRLPIVFTPSNLPVTECEIDGKRCHALIDLGSSRDLTCNTSQIQTDTLRHIYTVEGVNLWDEKQRQKVYAFPSYCLGKAEIRNITLTAGDTLRTDTDISMKKIGDFRGDYFRLGRPLLYRSNLYFDFPNAAMYLVDRKKQLKKIGVDLTQFEKVPYELTSSGICLNVNVGSKELRLCLDTGASGCLFKSEVELDCDLIEDNLGNSCYRIDSFQIGDSIYGPQVLYPLEIASRWDFDGLLGMDFLKKHPFFIDENFIYFKKPLDEI